jgi:3-phenylpropionate/trans-cinnamate dioxygenase ferredoxin reductase component
MTLLSSVARDGSRSGAVSGRIDRYDVVIVGAGHGGAQAAIALRQARFGGSIALIGAEPDLPYERPPLSKEFLCGDRLFERMLIRPAEFWQAQGIQLICGRTVCAVDAADHRVTLEDGERVEYGRLVWAAGGSPRRLTCPAADLPGVHTVRTRADVERIRNELGTVTHVVIVGGGFIGLEAAATLRKVGKHVTVLEAQDRVLARVAAEPLSRFYEAEHRSRGVDVRLGANIERIQGAHGRVNGVTLLGGETLPAEMVIVGIGITPVVAPLIAAGARGENGVAIDANCRTSLPDVFALGDCALHESAFADGARVRIESVQNALDHAALIARHFTGAPPASSGVPWFWSNQYDLRLQTIGLSVGHDDLVVRGEPASKRFSLVYLKSGRVVALDCINAAADYMQGRSLIVSRACVNRTRLADPAVPLKALIEIPGRVGSGGPMR